MEPPRIPGRFNIAELNAGVATEAATYPRCIDSDLIAPEVGEYSITVAIRPDRKMLAAQEWEYGGFSITAHPDVSVEDLMAIASGLRAPRLDR